MERDEVLPLNGPNQNLDDLGNVQGFNSVGKRNELYCFKLAQNGMYIREPIFCPSAAELRSELLKENKNDYEIDIILKNNMVICKGDSDFVNRIINSGSMFGNFVSDNKTVLRKINKKYYLSSNGLTILNFKTQFLDDLKLLTNPPNESEFIIEGVLLDSFDNELELIKGLFVSVQGQLPETEKVEDSLNSDQRSAALRAEISEIPQQTNFQIIITKNEENFNIKSFPEELKIRTEYDINLNTIKINNKILLSRIKFRT